SEVDRLVAGGEVAGGVDVAEAERTALATGGRVDRVDLYRQRIARAAGVRAHPVGDHQVAAAVDGGARDLRIVLQAVGTAVAVAVGADQVAGDGGAARREQRDALAAGVEAERIAGIVDVAGDQVAGAGHAAADGRPAGEQDAALTVAERACAGGIGADDVA